MSSKKTSVHTVPNGNGWANKQDGKIISKHERKSNAQEAGRKQAMASKTEHVIHKLNGQIGEKNSYGPDSCPPKDKK